MAKERRVRKHNPLHPNRAGIQQRLTLPWFHWLNKNMGREKLALSGILSSRWERRIEFPGSCNVDRHPRITQLTQKAWILIPWERHYQHSFPKKATSVVHPRTEEMMIYQKNKLPNVHVLKTKDRWAWILIPCSTGSAGSSCMIMQCAVHLHAICSDRQHVNASQQRRTQRPFFFETLRKLGCPYQSVGRRPSQSLTDLSIRSAGRPPNTIRQRCELVYSLQEKASNAGILFIKTHTYTSTHTQPHILSTQQRILLREKNNLWTSLTDCLTTNHRHRNERLTVFSASSNKRQNSCPRHRCFENSSCGFW